jgi:hypothetical protein
VQPVSFHQREISISQRAKSFSVCDCLADAKLDVRHKQNWVCARSVLNYGWKDIGVVSSTLASVSFTGTRQMKLGSSLDAGELQTPKATFQFSSISRELF